MLAAVPEEILSFCEGAIGKPIAFKPASGGCINNGGIISSASGQAFVKWNSAVKFPLMFEVEALGLNLLSAPACLKIPKVLNTYHGERFSGLLLEPVIAAPRASNFWERFGHGLAALHRQSSPQFGLDHHNYIGSLHQLNEHRSHGVDFFVDCRLAPQLALAQTHNKIDAKGLRLFDKLKARLPQLLADEPPALVHGDLWSGNFMVGPAGEPVLIDPAVAFYHREADLAMTRLFGGFDSTFYQAYIENYPLQPGYEERFDIYNLYPLLVHVNLFGGSYYRQVLSILSRYV